MELVGSLVFAPLFGEELVDDGHDGAAQQAQQDSGEHGEDHVSRVVDVQVQPGEGHQEGDDGGGDAHALVLDQQDGGGLEAGDGVAGGEGLVQVAGHQPFDVALGDGHPVFQLGQVVVRHPLYRVEEEGAVTANQVFQDDVADDEPQHQRRADGPAGLPGLAEAEQNQGNGDPEGAPLAEQGDIGHGLVQKVAGQVVADEFQNGEVEGDGQGIQQCFCLFNHGGASLCVNYAAVNRG